MTGLNTPMPIWETSMPQPFFDRLKAYYANVAEVLKGTADAAAIFPNPTDRGGARERIYCDFLKQHAPSKCNVFIGGYLFDEDGQESKQLDVIVTTDTAPRFNFHNRNGDDRSFSPVEGTIAVVSVKSTLDKAELLDAAIGIASIPITRPLGDRASPLIRISDYEEWPLKIIYASNGINPETILKHLNIFYETNKHIPQSRRVDIIHIAGSCLIVRMVNGMKITTKSTGEVEIPEAGTYRLFTDEADIAAINLVLETIQNRASASTHILFKYNSIGKGLFGL